MHILLNILFSALFFAIEFIVIKHSSIRHLCKLFHTDTHVNEILVKYIVLFLIQIVPFAINGLFISLTLYLGANYSSGRAVLSR